MSPLGAIWFVVKTLLQVSAVIGLYWASSLAMYAYVSPFMPGYYEDSGLSDLQALLVMLLVWDRYFGPYASLLRDVGKTLYAAKRKQREE